MEGEASPAREVAEGSVGETGIALDFEGAAVLAGDIQAWLQRCSLYRTGIGCLAGWGAAHNAPFDLVRCGYNPSAVFNTNVNKHVEIAGDGQVSCLQCGVSLSLH